MDSRVTTLERLAEWKAVGTISQEQHDTLAALVRKERVSVYVELSALLYLGVLSFVGGLGWTMRAYVLNLGDAAILTGLSAIVVATFYYCFAKVGPYANTEVESPVLSLDYILYLGCLVLSAEITYVEYRFHIFDNWHHHLLIVSAIFGALAYRFDNRFVLSLALSSLAGWLGLRISGFDIVSADPLRMTALAYGVFVAGLGTLLFRQGIKAHFLDVYLHLSALVVLAVLASGIGEPGTGLLYFAALLLLCGASVALGIRYGKFAFVTYGVLYGYCAISFKLLPLIDDVFGFYFYGIVSGTMVLVALVALARRFGRSE
jgi:hypothetical protein